MTVSTYGSVSPYGQDVVYGGGALPDQSMRCHRLCGDGWRIDATDLATGVVKAVLHPVSMQWDDAYSKVCQGQIVIATRDPSANDIWPHNTGIYISRVMADGSRKAHYGGFVEKFSGSSGGATTLGLQSIEEFLFHRYMADDDEGLSYSVTNRQQTLIAADLVNLASYRGVPLTPVALASAISRNASWQAWELKNLGQALTELIEASQGVKYRRVHTYTEGAGIWSTSIEFADEIGEDRNIILRSDIEGWAYGLEVDAKDQASRVYAVGAGEDTGGGASTRVQKTATAYDTGADLPEFQASPAWTDVSDQLTLDTLAAGYIVDHRDPVTTSTITIAGLPSEDHPEIPDPDVLLSGDTVSVDIKYGVLTFEGKCRVLNQTWAVSSGAAVTRALALQTVVRPAKSVKISQPINANPILSPPAQVTAPPAATPIDPKAGGTVQAYPPQGLVVRVAELDELSCMQRSHTMPHYVWASNDENNERQVKLVSLLDGQIHGSYTPAGPARVDPESMAYHPDGRIFLGDTGDNSNNRPYVQLYATKEPTSTGHKGTLQGQIYKVQYPPSVGSKNAECLMIHPITHEIIIVTKEAGGGQAISFGTGTNPTTVGKVIATGLPANISDGTFGPDGKYVYFQRDGDGDPLVYNFATWTFVRELPNTVSGMTNSESITLDGSCSLLVGEEGLNSRIVRVNIPASLGAPCESVPVPPPSIATYPSQLIKLTNQKLTLPTKGGKLGTSLIPADQVLQPYLARYKNAAYFYPTALGVVFKCPVNGARTSTNTKYPRCELREMNSNGSNEASWDSRSGTHTMEIIQSVDVFPGGSNNGIKAGQIHDDEDDIVTCRVDGPNIWFTLGNDTDTLHVTSSYVKGTKFRIKFVCSNAGVKCYYNGVLKGTFNVRGDKWYFKAGCYVQANPSNGSGYGQVTIYKGGLIITHA